MKISKKLITLLTVSLLMTGCYGANKKNSNDHKSSVEVNKKIINKEVTLSKDFLEMAEIDDPQASIDELVNEKIIKSGKVNSDGSVTYVMTPNQHKAYMKSLKESFEEGNQDLINDSDNSILEIKPNDDFSTFDIYVDPNSYSSIDSLLAIAFYIQGGYYRMFNGDKDTNVIVNFINNNTKEIIESGNSAKLMESDTKEISSKDLDVKVEDLPYKIVEQKPDSAGSVYGIATFKNNSKYPIKYFEMSGVIPSTNETSFFANTDTVMPGETSSNFESFYEKGTDISKISYCYIKYDKEIYVNYDVKLDSYETY